MENSVAIVLLTSVMALLGTAVGAAITMVKEHLARDADRKDRDSEALVRDYAIVLQSAQRLAFALQHFDGQHPDLAHFAKQAIRTAEKLHRYAVLVLLRETDVARRANMREMLAATQGFVATLKERPDGAAVYWLKKAGVEFDKGVAEMAVTIARGPATKDSARRASHAVGVPVADASRAAGKA